MWLATPVLTLIGRGPLGSLLLGPSSLWLLGSLLLSPLSPFAAAPRQLWDLLLLLLLSGGQSDLQTKTTIKYIK
jgi:hypothetical protein